MFCHFSLNIAFTASSTLDFRPSACFSVIEGLLFEADSRGLPLNGAMHTANNETKTLCKTETWTHEATCEHRSQWEDRRKTFKEMLHCSSEFYVFKSNLYFLAGKGRHGCAAVTLQVMQSVVL